MSGKMSDIFYIFPFLSHYKSDSCLISESSWWWSSWSMLMNKHSSCRSANLISRFICITALSHETRVCFLFPSWWSDTKMIMIQTGWVLTTVSPPRRSTCPCCGCTCPLLTCTAWGPSRWSCRSLRPTCRRPSASWSCTTANSTLAR